MFVLTKQSYTLMPNFHGRIDSFEISNFVIIFVEYPQIRTKDNVLIPN